MNCPDREQVPVRRLPNVFIRRPFGRWSFGRKSREHGVDRTPYKGDRKISFVSCHSRAISMNIVRATAWTLHDAAQKAKGRLCGKRAGSPAALG